jgi:hypothetical protein
MLCVCVTSPFASFPPLCTNAAQKIAVVQKCTARQKGNALFQAGLDKLGLFQVLDHPPSLLAKLPDDFDRVHLHVCCQAMNPLVNADECPCPPDSSLAHVTAPVTAHVTAHVTVRQASE